MNPSEQTPRGRFIVIEGADGCGKTTHARLLCEQFRRENRPVVLAREPGGTSVGEEVRKILLNPAHQSMSMPTEMMLYMACRGQLMHEVIKPALERGVVVVCDRFLLSSAVYQGYAAGLDADLIREIGAFVTENVRPDAQIVLDVAYETARGRRSMESDRIEARGEEFHRRVIEGYRKIAAALPATHVIDANRSIEEVQRDIMRIVKREIG